MKMWMPVLYIIVEGLAFYAVAKWLGVGVALLSLLGLFMVGTALTMWQISQISRKLRTMPQDSPQLAGDLGLTLLGSVLLGLPGFVSSVVGLLLILPPTRAGVRKVVARQVQEKIMVMGVRQFERVHADRRRESYGSFGDGQVIDVEEITQWSKNVEPEDFQSPGKDK